MVLTDNPPEQETTPLFAVAVSRNTDGSWRADIGCAIDNSSIGYDHPNLGWLLAHARTEILKKEISLRSDKEELSRIITLNGAH